MLDYNWDGLTKEEMHLVGKIAKRAGETIPIDHMGFLMDIELVHVKGCKLRLVDWLAADEYNFLHDVCGIYEHLNRETGELKHCFVPRYAA